jgi:prostaglandin-E synthase
MNNNTSKVINPHVKWAQRKDRLYITIEVENLKSPILELSNEGRISFKYLFILKIRGTADDVNYVFDLTFYGEISKEDSKISLENRNIFLEIKKKTAGPHWPRLTKESGKLNYLHFDFAHFVEEDEEDEEAKDHGRNMQGIIK